MKPTAFELELLAVRPKLFGQAHRLTRDPERAADLVQDTLERAWRHRDSFTLGSNMTAWACLILRNQFFTDLRRSRRFVPMPDGLAEEISVQPNVMPRFELADTLAAMTQLEPKMRLSLELIAFDGLSYEEAADDLEVATGTIKSRVSRARAQLEREIRP